MATNLKRFILLIFILNGNLLSPNVSVKFPFTVKMREITNVAERILMSDWNDVESQFFGPILFYFYFFLPYSWPATCLTPHLKFPS